VEPRFTRLAVEPADQLPSTLRPPRIAATFRYFHPSASSMSK
jgi:hypothetical protein